METARITDDSGFPIVRIRLPGPEAPDRIGRFLSELSQVLDRASPFVALFQDLSADAEETLEERQVFAAWYRREKPRMAAQCRGMLYAAPDEALRSELQEELANFIDNPAFPFPFIVFASLEDAEAKAARLLAV